MQLVSTTDYAVSMQHWPGHQRKSAQNRGDGNCLFRALSLAETRSQTTRTGAVIGYNERERTKKQHIKNTNTFSRDQHPTSSGSTREYGTFPVIKSKHTTVKTSL